MIYREDLKPGVRVALYGGSFDPPHLGHLVVAKWVSQLPEVCDFVMFMPNLQNPLKIRKPTPFETRFRMLNSLVFTTPKVTITNIQQVYPELDHTIDVLEKFKEEFPGVIFKPLIGTDCFRQLGEWKDGDKILQDYGVIVYPRREIKEESTDLLPYASLPKISRILDAPMIELSSTQIRNWISEGKDVSTIVPRSVLEIIEEEKLYRK